VAVDFDWRYGDFGREVIWVTATTPRALPGGCMDDALSSDVLRRTAHAMAQEAVAERVRGTGWSLAGLVELRLGDLLPSPALDRLRRRRADLGLPGGDDAPLLVDDAGRRLLVDELPLNLLLSGDPWSASATGASLA
jgi:hypothetical protein